MSSTILQPNEIYIQEECGKSRKRTRNPQKHKIFKQKLKIQSGLDYTTKSGRIVKGKIFLEQIKCGCKKKCEKKINLSRQKEIFDVFYSLNGWSQKTVCLRSLVKSLPKKENVNFISFHVPVKKQHISTF